MWDVSFLHAIGNPMPMVVHETHLRGSTECNTEPNSDLRSGPSSDSGLLLQKNNLVVLSSVGRHVENRSEASRGVRFVLCEAQSFAQYVKGVSNECRRRYASLRHAGLPHG
jgi:hypothetical protein